MQKQDVKILLVEDDETVGAAVEEAFQRAGYPCRWATSADEAMSAFKITDYKVVILDCMLPKVNGIQLGEEFRKMAGDDFKILLVSGIFKDRSFSNDAIRKVKADGFYVKPFDIQTLVNKVDTTFEEDLEPDRDPLFQLMASDGHTARERLKAIEETETIHGFDLPWVYSLLVGTNLSGHLNLLTADGEVSSVAISNGEIVQVNVNDKTSYFGILLVEHGFTSSEEVEESLNYPSEKPLGERLVEANAMSPHAIRIIRREQMAIRLSKTVQDTSIQVSFLEHQVKESDVSINSANLATLLNDWVSSKVTYEWLRAYYTPWMEHSVKFGPEKSQYELVKSQSLLGPVPNLLKMVDNRKTLQEILDTSSIYEQKVLRALHFLFLERILVFDNRRFNSVDYSGKVKRLKVMLEDFEMQNYYEILGLSQKARDKEINRAYLELAKVLHPDKLDPGAPKEAHELQQAVFARIADAYDVLRDRNRRSAYVQELEMGLADEVLRMEAAFEDAVTFLHRGRYQKALEILDEIRKKKNQRGDLIIFHVWAKIKVGCPQSKQEKFIADVGYELNQVPPEERHSANYIFVKGLYFKLIGRFDKAYTYFKHASTMDPSLMSAKRELVALEGKDNARGTTGELTGVFSKFFAVGKKKSS
ncbi:MAG: response regulator [Bdellovibrionaceae bacterium]|nr:response regulator [Bdellovibrionales bacterium]MCB9082818.1 response regulator [Pseudobdellovibrionaceae bacterium]